MAKKGKGKQVVTVSDPSTMRHAKRPAAYGSLKFKPRGASFQPGNSFWTKRSQHPINYLFDTPEHLLEGAVEYFEHVDKNPEYVIEARNEDGQVINHPVPKRRPYTPEGLAVWLGTNAAYFRRFKADQEGKPQAQPFLEVIAWIENVIYNQQYTGAAVGTLNASIVARRLGISETINVGSGAPIQAPQLNVYNTGPKLASHEDEIEG